jgi:signal peptidase II
VRVTGRQVQVLIAATIVVLDQVVKMLVRSRMELFESRTLVPGVLSLTRVHNTGAAFGMLNGADFPYKTLVVGLIATAALSGLAMYAATLDAGQRLSRLGLALIIGGAAGNLIDRIAYGYVLDFVDAYYGNWHFWAFNVADAAISVGVALMILDILGMGRPRVSRAV